MKTHPRTLITLPKKAQPAPHSMGASTVTATAAPVGETAATLSNVSEACSECMACVRQCAFLTKYGTPKALAISYESAPKTLRDLAFECSLCGLCTTICPDKADPTAMFLALRRESTTAEETLFPRYKPILGYEKIGNSPIFSCYSLPKGCDTIFFPGCTLPGKHAHATSELFAHMRGVLPSMGIVLDCCNKPSHDLGRQNHFATMFEELLAFLLKHGIRNILVACPNCHKVFSQYAPSLNIRTVYEFLHDHGLQLPASAATAKASRAAQESFAECTVHDPCPLRLESGIHAAVRALLASSGIAITEMRHNRRNTLCCGEGGSVGFRAPELALSWGTLRAKEAQNRNVATYCAGCVNYLGRHVKTMHVLDLLFPATGSKALKKTSGFRSYLERLRFKRYIKSLPAAVYRERPIRIGDRFVKLPQLPRLHGKRALAAATAAGCGLLWFLLTSFA